MTLNPCQLVSNYDTKFATIKRFIIDKIDSALGSTYDPVAVEVTVDFGLLKVNGVETDGLTNKIKQVFGDVSNTFINTVRVDAIDAAEADYIEEGWETAVFTILSGEIPRYLECDLTFTGSCPLP